MSDVQHTPFTPVPWQARWLAEKFAKYSRNVLVCARRSGKSTLLTNTMLACAWRVPGIYGYGSPLLQQSKDIAEPMLRKAVDGIPGVQWRESESRLILPNGSEIICFATARGQAQRARGLEFTGVCVDEAAHADPETIDGILLPALASVQGSWAAFCGTVRGMDALYDLAQRGWSDDPTYSNWATTTIDVEEAGMLSPEAIAELKAGMTENAIRRELYNDWTVSEETALINLMYATAAVKRCPSHLSAPAIYAAAKIIGVDVAREGKDRNVFILRQGPAVVDIEAFDESVDLNYVAGRLKRFIDKHTNGSNDGIDAVCIDGTGVGAGLYDIIQNRVWGPTEFVLVKAGAQALDTDAFFNRRAELYQMTADWIQRDDASIPDHAGLVRELTAPTYTYDEKGRLRLERKDQIAKRLNGMSTDHADALTYTFAAGDIQRQTHDPLLREYEMAALQRDMERQAEYDPF